MAKGRIAIRSYSESLGRHAYCIGIGLLIGIVIKVRNVYSLTVLVLLLVGNELVASVSEDRTTPLPVFLHEEVDVNEHRHLAALAGLSPCPYDLGVPSESRWAEHLGKFLDTPHRIDVMLSLETACLNLLLCLVRYTSYSLIDREVAVLLDLIAFLHIYLGLMIERQFMTAASPFSGEP